MSFGSAVAEFFDAYSLRARVFPAVLVVAPLVWTSAMLLPAGAVDGIAQILGGSVVLALGGTFLLAVIARSKGKVAERKLIADWGGLPTTLLLRHRDSTLDPHTKARYHARLATIAPGVPVPDRNQEAADPHGADAIYRSVVACLLEMRRGPEYRLVHKENAEYGFRRNLFGLRATALVLLAILLGGTWWLVGVLPADVTAAAFHDAWTKGPSAVLASALNMGAMIAWWAFVDDAFVRQAGDQYAIALLRTLDGPI